MIGPTEEVCNDLALSALSSVVIEGFERMQEEDRQQLIEDIAAGRTLRIVVDINNILSFHILTCTGAEGLDIRHVITVRDDRPRGSWAHDLFRRAD